MPAIKTQKPKTKRAPVRKPVKDGWSGAYSYDANEGEKITTVYAKLPVRILKADVHYDAKRFKEGAPLTVTVLVHNDQLGALRDLEREAKEIGVSLGGYQSWNFLAPYETEQMISTGEGTSNQQLMKLKIKEGAKGTVMNVLGSDGGWKEGTQTAIEEYLVRGSGVDHMKVNVSMYRRTDSNSGEVTAGITLGLASFLAATLVE